MIVPWNASWTSEARYEIRPCKFAGGKLAIWQPFSPTVGRPVFAKPHFVRQRRSIAECRCTVCGEKTPSDDRWTFGHGEFRDGVFMTQESPVHLKCAEIAMEGCPNLRASGFPPVRFPPGSFVLASVIGGDAVIRDFGIDVCGREVIGAMKFAWRDMPETFSPKK